MIIPKISIIIPIYNAEKFLDKCLKSVIGQTLEDIEIICINDGSTDGSLTIVQKFAAQDTCIKVISQNNKGLSVSRNIGLSMAKGKYVGFLDADDYIDSDFYAKLYQSAEQENADIAAASIELCGKDETKSIIEYDRYIVSSDKTEKFLLLGIPEYNYVWNKIYRLDFLTNHNLLFKENIYYEDIIFSIQVIYFSHKIVCVPQVKYHYQYNENSIVNTTDADEQKKQHYFNALRFQNEYIIRRKLKLPLHYNHKVKIKILGVPMIKIKEITDVIKKYYFFGLPFLKSKTIGNKKSYYFFGIKVASAKKIDY